MTAMKQAPARAQTEAVESDNGDLLEAVLARTAANVDAISGRYNRAIGAASGDLERAMLMGRAVNRLRDAITPKMMDEVMRLMNQPYGFMTDRGMPKSKIQEPYGVEKVKDCLIEALLAGFHLVGNEWNILAERMYGTLNGWKRKFEDLDGVTDINEVPGVPRPVDGQVLVRVAISWKKDGKENRLEDQDGKPGRVFPIISTQYSTADQTIGKARRKGYKAAWEKATGSVCTIEDGAVGETREAGPTRTQEALAKLAPPDASPTEAREPGGEG